MTGVGPDKQLPALNVRLDYAVNGAIPHLALPLRDRIARMLDSGGRAKLVGALAAFAQHPTVADADFRKAFNLDDLTGTLALPLLRSAAEAARNATKFGDLNQASANLAAAMADIGEYSLPRAIGNAKAGADALTQTNLKKLSFILEQEAGESSDQPSMDAIGHTVLNRMARNQTALVADVAGQYANPRHPHDTQPATIVHAQGLLDGSNPDPTGGATHFYAPKYQPKEGAPVSREGAAGGLESVPGVFVKRTKTPIRNYKPGWSLTFKAVSTPSIQTSVAKFYIQPGNGHVR